MSVYPSASVRTVDLCGPGPGSSALPCLTTYVLKKTRVFMADRLLTFRRVQPPCPAAMLGVVVHKHIVGDDKDMAVHVDGG